VRIYKEVNRDENEEINLYNKYAYDYFDTREVKKKVKARATSEKRALKQNSFGENT